MIKNLDISFYSLILFASFMSTERSSKHFFHRKLKNTFSADCIHGNTKKKHYHPRVKRQKETSMANIPSRSHCMLNKANTKRCISRKDVRYITRAEIDNKNRLVDGVTKDIQNSCDKQKNGHNYAFNNHNNEAMHWKKTNNF